MENLPSYRKMIKTVGRVIIKKMTFIDYIKLIATIILLISSFPIFYFIYTVSHSIISTNLSIMDSTIVLMILIITKLLFVLFLLDKDLNRTKRKFLTPLIDVYLEDEEDGVKKKLKRIKTKNLALKKFKLNKSYNLFEINLLLMQFVSYLTLIFFARDLSQLSSYSTDNFSEFFLSNPIISFLTLLFLLMLNININRSLKLKKNILFGIAFSIISLIIVMISLHLTYLFVTVFMFSAMYRSLLYIIAKRDMKNKYDELIIEMQVQH